VSGGYSEHARVVRISYTLSRDTTVDDAAAQIMLDVTATPACVPCPLCDVQTTRVHSRYTRTVADVPWGAYAVRVQVRVRKFFCDNPAGPRQIFTERLPTVAAPWARRTLRLAQHLSALGLALGGQAAPGSPPASSGGLIPTPSCGWYGWPRRLTSP